MFLIVFILLHMQFLLTNSSTGDRSPFYLRCIEKCKLNNCSSDGIKSLRNNEQTIFYKALFWSCFDECKYNCMWKTVHEFEERKWSVPQFHGKWPFIRLLGLQEPASVLFSLLNLLFVLKCFLEFKKTVRKNSPMYRQWLFFSYININAWIWSTIFHARDVTFTEKMDYIGSFSVVYCLSYCFVCRILKDSPWYLQFLIGFAYLLFYLNYVASIFLGSIDYQFNMTLNLGIGLTTGLLWFLWCIFNRKKQPYVIKLAVFVILASLSTLLEVFDKPPLFYVFDFHSIFHLVSAPLIPILYSFIINDCKYLRKIEENEKNKKPV